MAALLRAVLDAALPGGLEREIVVVDDASTDRTTDEPRGKADVVYGSRFMGSETRTACCSSGTWWATASSRCSPTSCRPTST